MPLFTLVHHVVRHVCGGFGHFSKPCGNLPLNFASANPDLRKSTMPRLFAACSAHMRNL
jgi:hypothetical protein